MNSPPNSKPAGATISPSASSNTPLFLTGFPRSGTTWLNTLFRDYFDAGFVNEGQFIVSFGRRLARYGDLEQDGRRRRLIRDLRFDPFFSILRRNYGVEIDWRPVWTTPPNFRAIVIEILKQIAGQTGRHRIGSKNPAFGWHLGMLNRLFPRCRLVHIVRDGRDCALSHRRLRWGHQNTYAAAVYWRNYLRGAQKMGQRMASRYLEIRYEDMLARPEVTMRALEEFVTGAGDGTITARFMREAKQLRTGNIARWRRSMTPDAQAIFEGVAGEALQDARYPLSGVTHNPTLVMRGLYLAHNQISRDAWHYARRIFPAISEAKSKRSIGSTSASPGIAGT